MSGLESLSYLINSENALFFNPLVLGRMESSRNYRRRAPGFVHVKEDSRCWIYSFSFTSLTPTSLAASNSSWLDSSYWPREQPGARGWRARRAFARLRSAWEFEIPSAQRRLCEPVPPGGNRCMCYGRASVPHKPGLVLWSSDVTVLLLPPLPFSAFKSTHSLQPRGDRGLIITSCLLGKRGRIYSFSRGALCKELSKSSCITCWQNTLALRSCDRKKPCSKVCHLGIKLKCA